MVLNERNTSGGVAMYCVLLLFGVPPEAKHTQRYIHIVYTQRQSDTCTEGVHMLIDKQPTDDNHYLPQLLTTDY